MRKVALVSGASRGIGRETARQLARAGYAVAVNYRSSEAAAQSLAQEIRSLGQDALAVQADVADLGQVERMVREITKELGEVGLLVNNAGVAQQKLFCDISPAEWERMFAVHVTGAYNCCKCVLPRMLLRHAGCIVNISSIWGMVGASCEVHYSAAKAALIGMTKALAKEVGPSGVRVNCVAPGVVRTDMCAGLDASATAALCEETPLGRLGEPAEIAQAVVFLAADSARFITGQVLSPNGGMVV